MRTNQIIDDAIKQKERPPKKVKLCDVFKMKKLKTKKK